MEFKESRGQVFVKNQGDRFLNLRMNESKNLSPWFSLSPCFSDVFRNFPRYCSKRFCRLKSLSYCSKRFCRLKSLFLVATRPTKQFEFPELCRDSAECKQVYFCSRCSIAWWLSLLHRFKNTQIYLVFSSLIRTSDYRRKATGRRASSGMGRLHFARFALPLHKKSEEKQKSSADSGTVTYGNVVIATAWAGQNTVAYYFWL